MMDSSLGLHPSYGSLRLILLHTLISRCCGSQPLVDQQVELGFAGAFKDTRQAYLQRIANDLFISELAALVYDLLCFSRRFLHVLFANQCFNFRNLEAFLDFEAERLLSNGRRRNKFNLNHVFFHFLLLFRTCGRFVFNHNAFLFNRLGRWHASGEVKNWLWRS